MITDSYSKMMSDISRRSMINNIDYGDDLGILNRESERENELNPYRSGSAPPTVEGSLSAVGGLFDASAISGFQNNGGRRFVTEEELRADPAYVNYYYNHVNLNPRLPPPLISKEDWRFAQRFQSGSRGGIGDRRSVVRSNGDETANVGNTLFSVQPRFGGAEENVFKGNGAAAEWGSDGLIGLPGLGLGSMQKSIAEIIQDNAMPVSRHPSRPASRNAIDGSIETSELSFGHLSHQFAPVNALQSSLNKQGISVGGSASHSYASALSASLSRSNTPDPQLLARAPSPRTLPVGGGKNNSMDKRSVGGPNSFNSVSPDLCDSSHLVAALSELNMSTNMVDEHNLSRSKAQQERGDSHNFFNSPGNGSYVYTGRSSGMGTDLKTSSLMAEIQPELKKAVANSYLTGSNSPSLMGGGSSSSHYDSTNNMNFSNYGLSGYSGHPGSQSLGGGLLGNGNMPSLYDNTAAVGMAGIDSRAYGGLPLGPDMLAAAAELQHLGRLGNHTAGNAPQVPFIDPLYFQYLRSNEYAAAQLAALNNPIMASEGVANPYMNLVGMQKGYLGNQKLQYGAPYLGKSGSVDQSHYGNPAFGLGATYPTFPSSPIGSGSSNRLNDRNLRFSYGMRNVPAGLIGAWNSEATGSLDQSFGSTLLDEFKSNKTKCFELSEIAGHVVEFSADQYGSRFIQQKLETASTEEKNMVFHEIMPQGLSLMTDVFGNYVIQKFFEHGTPSQIRELAEQLCGHVLTLSLQMYGCRVIQKAIEVVDLDQQTRMVTELDGHIMRCVRDQNGNHVIQKCIECIPEDAIQFIVSTFYDQVVILSTHPYGCRVIQRVLEHCSDPKTQKIMMDAIFQSVCMLAQDQYGNYVLQHVLEHGKPDERSVIIEKLTGQIVQMSQQKFASNVIEKCLVFGTPTERQVLVTEMLGSTDENEPLQAMMKDQFANYVVQKVLETCEEQQLEIILNRIKVHLNALKKYTYGKHIVARVEKLVAAGEKRISIQAQSAVA